jgi:ribosomal protein S18 acetylase RimI-like enzyme
VPEVPEINHAEILAIEQRALNAWPALHTRFAGGWALRLADGCTKRANSANPLAPKSPFAQVQATAERFYRRAGLPTVFRLTPLAPPDADGALAAAGYNLRDPSSLMIAPLSEVPPAPQVELAAHADAEWLAGVTSANATPHPLCAAHAAIVGAIRQPAAFATVREGGRSVGFGMAVAEQGYVGLFDLIVVPGRRGQGHGRALCEALLGWGRTRGAMRAYLQVQADNSPALGLYATLGFEPGYAYHYRVAA